MKILMLLILSFLSALTFKYDEINLANRLKQKAIKAFQEKDYLLSIRYHDELVKSYHIKEENIFINLANSYFKIQDYNTALKYFQKSLNTGKSSVRSEVYHQIGIIYAYKGKEKIALSFFKEALKANALNDKSRYNFELIKRKLENDTLTSNTKNTSNSVPPQHAKEDGSKDETEYQEEIYSKNNIGTDPSQKEDKKGDKEESKPENDINEENTDKDLKSQEDGRKDMEILKTKRYQEIKLSEAKAKMILEQMKIQEFLFINKLKEKKVVKKKSETPDW